MEDEISLNSSSYLKQQNDFISITFPVFFFWFFFGFFFFLVFFLVFFGVFFFPTKISSKK